MPISTQALIRNWIILSEGSTVGQVRDRVNAGGDKWVYLVVRLGDGRYAVLRLAELIAALQREAPRAEPAMLGLTLAQVPGLLSSVASAAVDYASMTTDEAKQLVKQTAGTRLVITAEGQVVGLLASEKRGRRAAVDLNWLDGVEGGPLAWRVGVEAGPKPSATRPTKNAGFKRAKPPTPAIPPPGFQPSAPSRPTIIDAGKWIDIGGVRLEKRWAEPPAHAGEVPRMEEQPTSGPPGFERLEVEEPAAPAAPAAPEQLVQAEAAFGEVEEGPFFPAPPGEGGGGGGVLGVPEAAPPARERMGHAGAIIEGQGGGGVLGVPKAAPAEPAAAFPGLAKELARVLGVPEAAPAPATPATAAEPEKRFINAEFENHPKEEPLQAGTKYTLAFDVDTEIRAAAAAGEEFAYVFAAEEELVELTVRLESKDFNVSTGPQKLQVPRTGKSKNKARFQVTPKQAGTGVINAIFLKDGNFVQLLTLELNVGAAGQPAILGSEPLGRGVGAAMLVQPRNLSLVVRNTGAGFDMILLDAATLTAFLPMTLQELDGIIGTARDELLQIVQATTAPGATPVYQAAVHIPPAINQQALARLARAGFLLFRHIFYGRSAGADVNLIGDRLIDLAEREERLHIHISSQQFMLPWGLLYLAREFDREHIDANRFLGLKHVVEHLPLQRTKVPAWPLTLDAAARLSVGVQVNADIDTQMRRPIIAGQLQYWDGVKQHRGTQVTVRRTVPEVVQALSNPPTGDSILYFYCHAASKKLGEGGGPDSSTLLLTGDGRLTLADLEVDAPPEKMLAGGPLVFINACESAELSPLFYDGFVPYFVAKGARGVIGTEVSTPALFAAEFARCFFDQFLDGKPLGDLVLELRQDFYRSHNNILGLLYALYCDGDVRVGAA